MTSVCVLALVLALFPYCLQSLGAITCVVEHCGATAYTSA